jgi:hypothetical protein
MHVTYTRNHLFEIPPVHSSLHRRLHSSRRLFDKEQSTQTACYAQGQAQGLVGRDATLGWLRRSWADTDGKETKNNGIPACPDKKPNQKRLGQLRFILLAFLLLLSPAISTSIGFSGLCPTGSGASQRSRYCGIIGRGGCHTRRHPACTYLRNETTKCIVRCRDENVAKVQNEGVVLKNFRAREGALRTGVHPTVTWPEGKRYRRGLHEFVYRIGTHYPLILFIYNNWIL